MPARSPIGPRTIALVGPYLSGKTSLLENILFATGRTNRLGKVGEKNTVGDSSAEARARGMSVELNVATTQFMGETFTFLDTPGSVEFSQETADALAGADAAVVVCEADMHKAAALVPLFKMLDELDLPRFVFVNKVDRASGSIAELFDALQKSSDKPLLLRQVPIRDGETVTGYVDLAQERAYVYRPGKPSEQVEIPAAILATENPERARMLEKLADFDDTLMEQLLEDVTPTKDTVMAQLSKDLSEDLVAPVFLGAADRMGGVHRLLKALRHEAPSSARAATARGIDKLGETLVQVLKTFHSARGGKLSVARVWRGTVKDGMTLNGERVSGLFHMLGAQTEKVEQAGPGDVVALGRLEKAHTGDTLAAGKAPDHPLPKAPVPQPVYALALAAADRNDEVKVSSAMHKLLEEDRSLRFAHDDDTNEWVLTGCGEMHMRVAADRLKSKFGLTVATHRPQVPDREAIKKSVTQPARFKRQSGGHGQFGDVTLEIKPLPRGSGFKFENGIVGGVVPKQFIPAVEAGVAEYLKRGPLGFPIVDVAVTLVDGKYHDVDSSEMSFKTAGRMAMQEGTPKCDPVLLEPIVQVELAVPSGYTSKVNSLVSARRGHILGFDAREGWPGWDVVTAHIPQVETRDLIIELRSLTAGVGTFTSKFDHLQELQGRLADDVIAAHTAEGGAQHAKA